jgi:hypothetical protein
MEDHARGVEHLQRQLREAHAALATVELGTEQHHEYRQRVLRLATDLVNLETDIPVRIEQARHERSSRIVRVVATAAAAIAAACAAAGLVGWVSRWSLPLTVPTLLAAGVVALREPSQRRQGHMQRRFAAFGVLAGALVAALICLRIAPAWLLVPVVASWVAALATLSTEGDPPDPAPYEPPDGSPP